VRVASVSGLRQDVTSPRSSSVGWPRTSSAGESRQRKTDRTVQHPAHTVLISIAARPIRYSYSTVSLLRTSQSPSLFLAGDIVSRPDNSRPCNWSLPGEIFDDKKEWAFDVYDSKLVGIRARPCRLCLGPVVILVTHPASWPPDWISLSHPRRQDRTDFQLGLAGWPITDQVS
jgi:hypothetical protein